jgi:CHAT domain-containing protein/tetratricopeptide (TPR) repeat protein
MDPAAENPARDDLLARVAARLGMAQTSGQAGFATTDDALADVVELLLARRPGVDTPVLWAAGWTFFVRHTESPDRDARLVNFVAACQLLGPVHATGLRSVPTAVSRFYEDNDPGEYFSADTGFVTDAHVWRELARAYVGRYLDHQDVPALRLCVGLMRLAVLAAAGDPRMRAHCQSLLASQVALLRPHVDDLAIGRVSLVENERALAELPKDDPAVPMHLSNLGVARLDVGQRTHDLALVAAAVDALREAGAGPSTDAELIRFNLGSALAVLASGGRLDKLPEATALLRAEAESSAPHADRAAQNIETMLGGCLRRLDEHPGELAALIDFCRDQIRTGPPDRPGDQPFLHALVYGLHRLFDTTGKSLQGLREAVGYGRRALALPSRRPDMPLANLNNLAETLRAVAYETGDADLLAEAVETGREAARMAAGRPELGMALASLSQSLASRYDLRGDRAAQREALEVSRSAVAATPEDTPERRTVLENHAAVLRNTAMMDSDTGLLREAIAIRRELAGRDETPEYVRARQYGALSELLHELARRTRGEERLRAAREAVDAGRRAVETTTPDGRHRNSYETSLGRALRHLTEVEGRDSAAAEAVEVSRRAAENTARDNPWWAFNRFHYGAALLEAGGLEQALAAFADAAGSPIARADVKIGSEQMYARTALRLDRPDDAVAAIERAVEHLAVAAPPDQLRADRERILDRVQGLTDDIVIACLRAGRPARAVELLEQARARLMSESLGARRELAEVEATDPELARLFEEAGRRLRELEVAEAGAHTAEEERDLLARRRAATDEWTAVRDRIRTETPLRDFLSPATAAALQEQGREGPIVIVTAGYAFILDGTSGPPRQVELPGLTDDEIERRVPAFLAARMVATDETYAVRARRSGQQAVVRTLAWLWEAAAEPILDAVGAEAGSRLWWCPVGLLNLLPWHAAGEGPGASVLDRVVSSYTANVGVLAHARARPRMAGPASLLVVAEPAAEGAEILGGVADEVRRIRSLVPDTELITGAAATKKNVLAALDRHRMVHIACHAVSDLRDPARSRLILADHASDPLTVRDLSALHLEGKELAMLAACSTVETQPTSGDEPLHLTAAFQLAGYRNVIGSLWPVSDAVAAAVAERVYAHVGGGDGAAAALHEAVRELRNRYPAAPTIWAPYVHMGV